MKNILVTGATGFVGKHFVRAAISKYKLFCLVRETSDISVLPDGVEYVYGDLSNRETLYAALKNTDFVVHLGAAVQSISKEENHNINVIGTQNLVEACKENDVRKIIHLSSINATFEERGVYGETKLQSEDIVKLSGIPYVILRPATIYGHGDKGLSATYKLLSKSKIIPIIGGAFIRPIYVNDVNNAILSALESKAALNNTYYIGGATKLTIREYMEKVADLTGTGKKTFVNLPAWPFKIIINLNEYLGKKWLMTYEQYLSMTKSKDLAITAAEKDLNFKPIDFDTGLKLWLEEVKPNENFTSTRR